MPKSVYIFLYSVLYQHNPGPVSKVLYCKIVRSVPLRTNKHLFGFQRVVCIGIPALFASKGILPSLFSIENYILLSLLSGVYAEHHGRLMSNKRCTVEATYQPAFCARL